MLPSDLRVTTSFETKGDGDLELITVDWLIVYLRLSTTIKTFRARNEKPIYERESSRKGKHPPIYEAGSLQAR